MLFILVKPPHQIPHIILTWRLHSHTSKKLTNHPWEFVHFYCPTSVRIPSLENCRDVLVKVHFVKDVTGHLVIIPILVVVVIVITVVVSLAVWEVWLGGVVVIPVLGLVVVDCVLSCNAEKSHSWILGDH